MNITTYLNESVNINEDKVATSAFKRIKKFINKETLDMSTKGFGGFKKDGKAMFAEFYREVVFGVLEDINFPELKKVNDHILKKYISDSLDDKKRNYLDKVLLSNDNLMNIVNKISEICKWDATTFALSISMFFQDQGFRDVVVKDGTEDVKESTIITNVAVLTEKQENKLYEFVVSSYEKKYKGEYWHFGFMGTNLNLETSKTRGVYEVHGDDGSFYIKIDLDDNNKPIKKSLKIEKTIMEQLSDYLQNKLNINEGKHNISYKELEVKTKMEENDLLDGSKQVAFTIDFGVNVASVFLDINDELETYTVDISHTDHFENSFKYFEDVNKARKFFDKAVKKMTKQYKVLSKKYEKDWKEQGFSMTEGSIDNTVKDVRDGVSKRKMKSTSDSFPVIVKTEYDKNKFTHGVQFWSKKNIEKGSVKNDDGTKSKFVEFFNKEDEII